MVSDL
jgi:hypothetical protein